MQQAATPRMIKRHVVGGLRHLLVDKDPFCPIKIFTLVPVIWDVFPIRLLAKVSQMQRQDMQGVRRPAI